MARQPVRKIPAGHVAVPRALVEQTVSILIQLPAHQVYGLVAAWERHIPGLITYQGGEPQETAE